MTPRFGLLLILIILLAFVWFVPWHSSAVARVVVATAVFILPGVFIQQWIYARNPYDVLRHITVGFATSICITSLLGIIARLLHLNYTFISISLFLLGLVGAAGMFWPVNTIAQRKWRVMPMVTAILLLIAAFLIITQLGLHYSYNRGVFVDDYSYAAQTTNFRTTTPYNFQEVMQGTNYRTSSRMLLAMLPLSYAVIGELSGTATHELFLVFRVVEIFLFVVAALGLARALKLSWSVSALSVVIQALIIVRFYRNDDVTSLYPEFMQDKGIAAYVLAPIFLRVLIDYLDRPERRKLWIVGIVALGMTFTHPTIYLITCGLIGFYLLILLIQTRRWMPILMIILVLILGIVPYLPLRLMESQHKFSLNDTNQDLKQFYGQGTWKNRMGDFTIYDLDHNLYGIKLKKFDNWAYSLFFAAVGVSLFRLGRSRAAAYLVACGLLWLSAVVPITAPLWGMAITPLHIRRILWLIPLALAAGYLLQSALELIGALFKPTRRLSPLIYLGVSLVILGAAFDRLPDTVSRNPLSANRFPPFRYHEIVELSRQWDEVLGDEPVITMGTKRYLNDVLPSLLPEAKIFFFRNVRTMMRQNSLPLDEAVEREKAFTALTGIKISFSRTWQLLEKYHVEYILADHDNTRLIDMLAAEKPDQFVLVARTKEYRLFRIIR
jgi:hypothetical protein